MIQMMNRRKHKMPAIFLILLLIGLLLPSFVKPMMVHAEESKEVTLRVSNWEEYIDEGDWDEDEVIDLESGDIFGENNIIDDFEEWYYETYGIKVNVEYSAFGSNEEFYNMYSLGNVYDLVCPSEYMMMKLAMEDQLLPYSQDFYDLSEENNYYIRGLSPYIRKIFDRSTVAGDPWSKYFAGYMWGVTGIVYNPEFVSREEASSWNILTNPKFKRQVTIKDNVRDSYFAALGGIKQDLLTSDDFRNDPNYVTNLENEMNDVSDETIDKALNFLKKVKDNTYSFESDAGKADMITGKVVANYQWSGDGVYTLDQAEEDDLYLDFAVPKESTNIYFDGWCMLKSGIKEDPAKQHAAEAFINFMSRPDNAIRNMYYIGYTSCIVGEKGDPRIFEYADWNFGAEDDEEDTVDYPLGYFFTGDPDDEDYIISAPADSVNRQLFAQYPDEETLSRSSIMVYFDKTTNDKLNQMWIRIRCYDIRNVSPWIWVLTALVIFAILFYFAHKKWEEKQY
ncbi:MAG: extracellular solute-binding protein [Eubacteriales bacterium]|nr:extracellular solute-binding protein [Eubacteriales bacterium]